jgi:hypothetical protein
MKATMFEFKGKVTQDINIDLVKVSNSELSDAGGVGKFFDF